MTGQPLTSYLDGWSLICDSTDASVEAMVAGADPDIRFSDVNSPNLHQGHDGIRHICGIARGKYPGARIAYRDLLCDGRNWSIRWTLAGQHSDGTTFSCPGASAGALGDDGKVIEHTDYWNRASLQASG